MLGGAHDLSFAECCGEFPPGFNIERDVATLPKIISDTLPDKGRDVVRVKPVVRAMKDALFFTYKAVHWDNKRASVKVENIARRYAELIVYTRGHDLFDGRAKYEDAAAVELLVRRRPLRASSWPHDGSTSSAHRRLARPSRSSPRTGSTCGSWRPPSTLRRAST